MSSDAPRSGPSKALGIIDLLIKLIGVGALIGILVMLLQINQGLREFVNGDKKVEVGVYHSGYGQFPIEAHLRTQNNRISVDLGNAQNGDGPGRPLWIRSADV